MRIISTTILYHYYTLEEVRRLESSGQQIEHAQWITSTRLPFRYRLTIYLNRSLSYTVDEHRGEEGCEATLCSSIHSTSTYTVKITTSVSDTVFVYQQSVVRSSITLKGAFLVEEHNLWYRMNTIRIVYTRVLFIEFSDPDACSETKTTMWDDRVIERWNKCHLQFPHWFLGTLLSHHFGKYSHGYQLIRSMETLINFMQCGTNELISPSTTR